MLEDLLASWQLSMKAERKADKTIRSYLEGVRRFLAWCAETGTTPELTAPNVRAFIADLLEHGAEASTALSRQKALRQYAGWLVREGEMESNPLVGLKPPKQDKKITHALTDDQLKALLKACQGKTLRDKRDEALLRLMAETGLRASETIGLELSDVDLNRGLAIVHKGKGNKGRVVPFGPQTAAALDRYIRARRAHQMAETNALWLGSRNGSALTYPGLDKTLKARAVDAGVGGFHLHLLRHTAAHRWLRAGGSEQGLMAVAGWSNRTMLDRYTSSSASERAADEARGLNLGAL